MEATRKGAAVVAALLAMGCAGGAAAGERILLTDLQLDAITAGALTTLVTGEANAIGQDTLASGDIDSTLRAGRKVSVARGRATFSASASSTGGDTAFASASTAVAVDGADLVIVRTRRTSGSGTTDDGTWATETSTTRYFALDIEGVDLPNGGLVLDRTSDHGSSRVPRRGGGNATTLNVDAQAHGNNTLVAVDGSALSVGGRLSSVYASVLSAGRR